jgi:DNA-binding response OmpR family regulator
LKTNFLRHPGARLKILFLGLEIRAQQLFYALEGEDIKAIVDPDIRSTLALIEETDFDLVIIDSCLPSGQIISQKISGMGTLPVVLIVDQSEESWKTINSFNADGFIIEGSSHAEILARIRAVYRRSKRFQAIMAG